MFCFCCSLRLVLDSDAVQYGGHSRIQSDMEYVVHEEPWDNRRACVFLYLPCRSALVLAPKSL